jgi:hypothetical protein
MQYRLLCVSLALAISACTFNEPRLRPQPITAYANGSPLALGVPVTSATTGAGQTSLARVNGDNNNNLELPQVQYDCVEYQSTWNVLTHVVDFFSDSKSVNDNCIYVRAKPQSIVMIYDSAKTANDLFIPTLSEEQNDLIYHSDYNCANFRARVFATRANASFGKSFYNTLISGVATVITPAAGIPDLIPTALNASNTVVSGTVSDYVDAYIENQSLQDLDKAILAKRQLLRSEMKARICATREWQLQHLSPECISISTTSQHNTETSSAVTTNGAATHSATDGSSTKSGSEQHSTTTSTSSTSNTNPCLLNCNLPADGNYPGYIPRRYWDMQEAVDDVTNYDSICSLEGGLAELAQAAADKQTNSQKVAAGVGSPVASPSQSQTASPASTGSAGSSPAGSSTTSTTHQRHRRTHTKPASPGAAPTAGG